MNTLEKFEKGHLKELQSDNKLPKFSSGDTIKVCLLYTSDAADE